MVVLGSARVAAGGGGGQIGGECTGDQMGSGAVMVVAIKEGGEDEWGGTQRGVGWERKFLPPPIPIDRG